MNAKKHLLGQWSHDGVQRILENLCNNALKYGAENAEVTVTLEELEEGALLSVNNKGPVISPEDQITLFEPHTRTSSAIESKKQGWGLGLTLVKGLTESHGGSVRVESNERQGTTFVVYLPKSLPTHQDP